MREQVIHRPLVGVLIGICLGLSLTFGWWSFVAILGIVGAVRDLRFGICALVAFGLGWWLKPPEPAGFIEHRAFSGVAHVVSVPEQYGDGVGAMVNVLGQRYRLLYDGPVEFTLGDTVRVEGILGPLSEASGYGGGVRGVLRESEVSIERSGPVFWHWGASVARSFRESALSRLSERSAALVRGVCFNQRDGLTMDDWEAFRRFGVVHLLSASGFHAVVVAAMLLGVFSLVPIPRMAQLAFVFAGLGLFAMAAGFQPPILRAVLMAVVALSAFAFRREADGFSAVAFAGVVNLVYNPCAVVELGFHLSMVTTLGLVMVITERRWSKWDWGRRILVPNLVAMAASLPLVGFVFGEVSLTGLLGNLVVAPLAGLLVMGSLLCWLVGLLVPPLGGVLWRGIDVFAGLVSDLVGFGAGVPGGSVAIPAYSVIGLACMYGLLVLAWGRYAMD